MKRRNPYQHKKTSKMDRLVKVIAIIMVLVMVGSILFSLFMSFNTL